MKRQSYINKAELLDLFKVGIMAAEFASVAERTPEKDWRRLLKTMATWCEKIMMQRLECIEPVQRKTVERRYKHTEIKFYSSDDYRVNKGRYENEKTITLEAECLYDIMDLAMLTCYKCPQGACVKDCRWRQCFHDIAVPPFRTEPKEGECEFRYEPIGTVRNVTPQYRTVEILREEQKAADLRSD